MSSAVANESLSTMIGYSSGSRIAPDSPLVSDTAGWTAQPRQSETARILYRHAAERSRAKKAYKSETAYSDAALVILLDDEGISPSWQEASPFLELARVMDSRIAALAQLAAEEEIQLSSASESDLRAFVRRRSVRSRPMLVLLDNGNFRAIWKGPQNQQVGLQFLGGRLVQYVLLAPREGLGFVAQAYGRDTVDRMIPIIKWHGLGGIL